MRPPRPPRPPHRLLVLVTLVVLSAMACRYEEVGGVGTRTADDEFPPQSDVVFGDCRSLSGDRLAATATVTNHTDTVASYELTVAFTDAAVRLAERSHWIRNLRPGESASMDRSWWIENADRISDCSLLTVNRFG